MATLKVRFESRAAKKYRLLRQAKPATPCPRASVPPTRAPAHLRPVYFLGRLGRDADARVAAGRARALAAVSARHTAGRVDQHRLAAIAAVRNLEPQASGFENVGDTGVAEPAALERTATLLSART